LLRATQVCAAINTIEPGAAQLVWGDARHGFLAQGEAHVMVLATTVNEGVNFFFNNDPDYLARVRERNHVVADLIDSICFPSDNPFFSPVTNLFLKRVDALVAHNKYTIELLRYYPDYAKHHYFLIPHQWNMELADGPPTTERIYRRACYVGGPQDFQADASAFSDLIDFNFNVVKFRLQQRYDFQIQYRKADTLDFRFKPCTKLAAAADCNAFLVTSLDEAMVDILGRTYELFTESEPEIRAKLQMAMNFELDELAYCRSLMRRVRDHLSPKTTARRYLAMRDRLVFPKQAQRSTWLSANRKRGSCARWLLGTRSVPNARTSSDAT
jgi:hypothetical protein